MTRVQFSAKDFRELIRLTGMTTVADQGVAAGPGARALEVASLSATDRVHSRG